MFAVETWKKISCNQNNVKIVVFCWRLKRVASGINGAVFHRRQWNCEIKEQESKWTKEIKSAQKRCGNCFWLCFKVLPPLSVWVTNAIHTTLLWAAQFQMSLDFKTLDMSLSHFTFHVFTALSSSPAPHELVALHSLSPTVVDVHL